MPRATRRKVAAEVETPRATRRKVDVEVETPRATRRKVDVEVETPRSTRREADVEVETPRASNRPAVSPAQVIRSARLPDYGDDDYDDDALVPSSAVAVVQEGVEEDFEARLWTSALPETEPADGAVDELPSGDGDEEPQAVPATDTEVAMRGLFGRDSAYLMVAAAQSALAALSIPITTRLLGSQFAVVTTSIAVMQVLVAFGVFSLPTAIQRNYRDDDAGRDARRTISIAIVTATITLVVAYASGPLWSPALGLGTFGAPLRYAVIWAGLSAVTFATMALLRSRNLFRVYALVSFVQAAAAEVFSVLLVVFVHRSASEFILGEMLMQAVAVVVALLVTRPLPLRRSDRQLVVSSLKYASGLLPAAVAAFLLTSSDRIIIRHDLPIIEVARYGAVYNIAAIPILLLGLLDPVWLPRFFKLNDPRVRARVMADSRDVLFRLLIPTVLGLGFGAPLVLSVWVPGSYHPAGLVIVIVTISAGAFPVAGYISANRVLLMAGRTFPIGIGTVLAAGFNIICNIILVPLMGIEGSALSTSLAYILLLGLATLFSYRIQTLRRPGFGLLLGCAMAVAVALGCTLLPWTGVFAVVRAVLTLACVVVVVALLRDVIGQGNGRWPSRLARGTSRR
jgi:O-antigen/teichoic acid export membrane protein